MPLEYPRLSPPLDKGGRGDLDAIYRIERGLCISSVLWKSIRTFRQIWLCLAIIVTLQVSHGRAS